MSKVFDAVLSALPLGFRENGVSPQPLQQNIIDRSFYPSIIKESCITLNDFTYNLYPFKVLNIDFIGFIITINKNIILPPNFVDTYADNWQIHRTGTTPNDPNNFIQLTSQLSVNTFGFTIVAGQTSATVQANFVKDTFITFINPYQSYKLLNPNKITVDIASFGGTPNNHFCQYLYKKNGIYYGIFVVTLGGTFMGFGTSQSSDFITWTAITKITPATSRAAWMDVGESLNDYYPRPGINCVQPNGSLLSPLCFLKTGTSLGRIGLSIIASDLSSFTPSSNYFTFATGPNLDDPAYSCWYPTLVNFNGLYYLAFIVNTNTLYIYTWDGNQATMQLNFLQKIDHEISSGLYDSNGLTIPCFFILNNKLFLTALGTDITLNYSYANLSNTVGLFEMDTQLKVFKPFISQPFLVNPKLSSWSTNIYNHFGQTNFFTDDDGSVKGILSFTGSGTNTYVCIPIQLNHKSKNEINEWLAIQNLISANNNIVTNDQTGTTYTPVLNDVSSLVTLNNAAAITVTIPAYTTLNFPIDSVISFEQKGAGKVTFVGAGGVTINSKGGNKSINGQNVVVTIKKESANVWLLFGDLIA